MKATPSPDRPSPPRGLIARTFRRHRWSIGITWLLASAFLLAWANAAIRPIYRAMSILRVDPAPIDLYDHSPAKPQDVVAFLRTNVQLLTSPNVLSSAGSNPRAAVLDRVRDSKDVVGYLRKAIRVVIIPETYLIEVSMNSPSASESATLVNAVVDAFMESSIEWADGMTRNKIKNLEAYLGDLKNQSTELERRWKDLVAKVEVSNRLRPSSLVNADHRARIEEKLIASEIGRFEDQARIEVVREAGSSDMVKVGELETRVKTARILERNLRARLASSGEDSSGRKLPTDEVEISVVRHHLDDLRKKQDSVTRKLDQLRFEARGEARVRVVNPAVPSGKPVGPAYRPLALAVIPLVAFLAVLGLFSGVEGVAGRPDPAPMETSSE